MISGDRQLVRKSDYVWRSGPLLQRRVIKHSELYIVMGRLLILTALHWMNLLPGMRT